MAEHQSLLRPREGHDDAFSSHRVASSSSSKTWTKVLAGSGVMVLATTLALNGNKGNFSSSSLVTTTSGTPSHHRLGEGEAASVQSHASKSIKLHTACAPLHALDFHPDPTSWKKNMGARVIVRSQQNPELAFDRGIEMTATHCGAFEVDANVLAPGDEFTFALYEKNGPNGPAFRKDAGCISTASNPDSCMPENNLGRSPNNMFNMNECTASTFSDSTKTFYDRVYKESDGRSFVWGSCHSDCAFSVQSELALCELDAQQQADDGQQQQAEVGGASEDDDEPSDGSMSGLLNMAMSAQKVFVPAITNSEHTKASVASAQAANEMTPEEILAMDKADLKGAADQEEEEKVEEVVPEPAESTASEAIPENETPAQKIERLQKELKVASEKAQRDAENAAEEEKKANDEVSTQEAQEEQPAASAAATTDAAAQAQTEQTQAVATSTVDQLNDLQSQSQGTQQPTDLAAQMRADAAAIATPEATTGSAEEASATTIQAESQTQIDRQTRLEKGEIRAAKNALHPTGKKSSHKSKARKFIADADGEEHNVVVELEVPPQQDEEVVVEKSEGRENIPDQPEPLTEEEEASANAQRDEIDEILAHADDADVFEEEQKEAAKKKSSSSSSSEEGEEIDFKAAKIEEHKRPVQRQLEEEKEAFEVAKAKKEQDARERRAARAKAKADAIRFAGKTPEEIELMKRMDALDEMSAQIGEEEAKSKRKAEKANKNKGVIGVSPEEQIMLDQLNGSMDDESAKEAADALASVDFDDSVFASNDDDEEQEQEQEQGADEPAVDESENASSDGTLEGSLESSYEVPASNMDPVSLKTRKWKKVATTVPLSEGTDTGAMEAKLAKRKHQEKLRNKVDPETGLTKEEQKLIDSLNFNSPAEDDSFANGSDEAGEAALGERKTFDAPIEEEEVAMLGVSPRALAQINRNRMYNEAVANLGEATVASKFEMAAQQARALTKLGSSEDDDAKASLEERMRQLESGELPEQAVMATAAATPEVATEVGEETSSSIDPIAAQYMPKGIETNGMTKEEMDLIANINADEKEVKRKKAEAKAAAIAAAKAEAEAKANAPKPYHEKGMIVIQNVKVPHTFKLDPYKNVTCNPSPTCIVGVPIPGVGCCPEELVDKEEAPKVGDEEEEEEKEKEKASSDEPSRKHRYERYDDDDDDEDEKEDSSGDHRAYDYPSASKKRPAQDSSDLYFSQKDVDERGAPKEEVEEELATTSYDFVAEKKDHKSRHHAEDVVDSASSSKKWSSSKKSTEKEDIETPSSPSSTKEYATAISKKQKVVPAAEKAKNSRIEAEKVAEALKKAYEDAMKAVKTSEKKEEKKAAQAYIARQKVNHLNDESRFGESRLAKAPGKQARKVCQASKWKDLEWPFFVGNMTHPSCQSQNGGVNDMGTEPEMCEDDLASVRFGVSQGKAECMLAHAKECRIPMHDFKSLNYDWTTSRCKGVWGAPLWMSPDTWQWGPDSGEIDGSEFCMRKRMQMNFAGGGHEVELDPYNIDEAWGHTTIRKDDAGIITVTTCKASEAEANGGECFKPKYKDCKDCEFGERGPDKEYACWCNEDPNQTQLNIYGSGGCAEGANCEWTLLSDVWNGVGGDQSYHGCMGEVPTLGVDKNEPNFNSHCEFSVENILVKGHGLNGAMQWGKGSPNYCRHLTVQNVRSAIGVDIA